ncbi:putative PHD and RING finger domain protein [Aspergillus saccharolyticus JOP 1030-1]|uniref:PHD and RING finger domain protein n=1 Tax=Aspergillus saccharolyticus JOP 1030-1 TaxID=1450539 RepID=A0A318ZZY8_9EURO|nr:hypothetical protein BP01DRAFT_295843 [Aspergillus saccharolyticus JOP 1030-1]PYH45628.1 hypothetical protein BP01DRAFT_295843 [Aspergillus saccharolyticus JOP 1030-1]
MSDTCIVCLGDLGESASDPLAVAAEAAPRLDLDPENKSADIAIKVDGVDGNEDPGQIAQLLPCGHILHNNCLKPWVERANSCPICRRSFNVVELSDRLGGPVISSYVVEDRTQTAEVDPSMFIEYIDEDVIDFRPCPVCGDADNEDLLLLCDGCDAPSHTYCVGLDDVPSGPWYCARCEDQRRLGRSPEAARPQDRRNRRTRAQQRVQHNRRQTGSANWARVWQHVWNNLNIDLDFPFDDDMSLERARQQQRRNEANQREFRAWQRRLVVAERQGGSNHFRDTAALLDIEAPRPSRPRAPREPTPEPESLEEMRAWNAFERAREIENDPSAARKRKEPTMSPSPVPSEPARKLKRPRTRRAEDLAALAHQNGESSRAASAQATARINAEPSGEPSFLQSLLKEVESSSKSNGLGSHGASAHSSIAPTDHFTPGPASPSISPAPSNQSSPRMSSATPPPHGRSRPISPLQIGSPAEPSSPPFSPDVSPIASEKDRQEDQFPRHTPPPRWNRRIPRAAARPAALRSLHTSPSRAGPSSSVKSAIQKLVGSELKPFYRSKLVSKDEYTDINRTISRMLYERVGDVEVLEADARVSLEGAAKDEVGKAVDALRQRKDAAHGHVLEDSS